jgi:hypothetical protein
MRIPIQKGIARKCKVNWEEEICGEYEGKTPPVRPSHK